MNNKVNKITLDRILHPKKCNCEFYEIRGKKYLTKQCSFHKKADKLN